MLWPITSCIASEWDLVSGLPSWKRKRKLCGALNESDSRYSSGPLYCMPLFSFTWFVHALFSPRISFLHHKDKWVEVACLSGDRCFVLSLPRAFAVCSMDECQLVPIVALLEVAFLFFHVNWRLITFFLLRWYKIDWWLVHSSRQWVPHP